MHKSRRIKITDLNPNLICVLCSGYLIDATTIIECLHSFCRSCIVKYLESNKYCPICDVQVHKTKPLLNIRSDQTLQDIVYKLVPGLFQNEMCRRRDFYSQHLDQKPSSAEESGEVTQFSHIYTADESISLSLEYYNNNEEGDNDNNTADLKSQGHPSRRYLRCPAAVSVQHLQKLIRAKYGLSNEHRVDILYLNDRLREDFTLMDIAYIYLWRRKVPLHLTYRIFEVAKRIKLEETDEKVAIQKDENENSNKTWKEVQLQISENGIMSVMNIEEEKPIQLESAKIEPNEEVKESEVKEEIVVKEEKKEVEIVKVEAKKTEVVIKEEIKQENKVLEVKIGDKRKLEKDCDEQKSDEPSAKIPKPSISISKPPIVPLKNIHQLSRNHPLKIHSQTIKNHTNAQKVVPQKAQTPQLTIQKVTNSIQNQKTVQNTQVPNTSENKILNNNNNCNIKTTVPVSSQQSNVQNTPKTTQKSASETPKSTGITSESKIANSTQNIPKYTQATSTSENTVTTNTKYAETSIQHTLQRIPISSPSPNPIVNSIQYSKVSIVPKKSPAKLGTPIGYKTLRDPPKAWNPQISRQNFVKSNTYSTTIASTSDSKIDPKLQVNKPAKFFKMRNNMPRYLGNPASGVKPMYQVREGDKSPPDMRKSLEIKKPEKVPEKIETEPPPAYTPKIKVDKIEVKKQGNIIKIDPKTLRPITDKTDTPSCSDLPEMKINQSTVPILNPLRTQRGQTSPKIDRRSPKSPYLDMGSPKSPLDRSSPKINIKNNTSKSPNSPISKKDKLNLNFTPSNPFIPNLSPNLAPNQFLYPNFPSYDPRVMNNLSYHNIPLGLSMFYSQPRLNYPGLSTQSLPLSPNLMSSLNLEVNKNLRVTKNYDLPSMSQLSSAIEVKKSQTTVKRAETPRETFNGESVDKEPKSKPTIKISSIKNLKDKIELPKKLESKKEEPVKVNDVNKVETHTERTETSKEEKIVDVAKSKTDIVKVSNTEGKSNDVVVTDKQIDKNTA